MSSSATYQPSSLAAFFVFNPTLGDEFTEGEKILSFHPKTVDIDKQKTFVGLSEGLIAFSKDYSPNKPIESMHTEKHRYSYLEAEKDHWMVLVVQNPQVAKDPKAQPQFAEDELDDSILASLLKHAYSLFSLFNGPMGAILSAQGAPALRQRLDLFLEYYLTTVRFPQLRYFMDITGFQFFPVDKPTFTSLLCLADAVSAACPEVASSAILFDGRLIWTGLPQPQMRALYNLQQENFKQFFIYFHANQGLLDGDAPTPVAAREIKNGKEVVADASESKSDGLPNGVFLTGPLKKQMPTANAPLVFVNNGSKDRRRLVVYQIGKLCCMFLLHDDASGAHSDPGFYRRLEGLLVPELRRLAAGLLEQASASDKAASEESFRFLYFNHMNLALKASLSTKGNPLTTEVIKVLRSIHADFQKAGVSHGVSEVCVRTRNDGWVVGRKSAATQRELFVLLGDKAGDLNEVTAEVDRLAAEHFNIFIDQKASIV